jgi:soluble cytochrome b562
MKIHSLLLLFALLTSSATLLAEGDSPLENQMQILSKGNRQLTKQITDASKQNDNIAILESMKKAATDSMNLDPRKAASLPAADKQKFLDGYRAKMDSLIEALGAVEDAVKAGQYDKAKSLLSNVMAIKKAGHEEYKQD